jgi:hypothetical protein
MAECSHRRSHPTLPTRIRGDLVNQPAKVASFVFPTNTKSKGNPRELHLANRVAFGLRISSAA